MNLTKPGVFWTVQGEGALIGTPMVFVRLAGCSIGCHECDTDYLLAERVTVDEIGRRIDAVKSTASWVWITGGEPADQPLGPLLEAARLRGRVALATSGTKSLGGAGRLIDFLSVSPHATPEELVLTRGSQINLVPGLNGLKLLDWEGWPGFGFESRWVTPLNHENRCQFDECIDFVSRNPGWRLGVQAHKLWGLP